MRVGRGLLQNSFHVDFLLTKAGAKLLFNIYPLQRSLFKKHQYYIRNLYILRRYLLSRSSFKRISQENRSYMEQASMHPMEMPALRNVHFGELSLYDRAQLQRHLINETAHGMTRLRYQTIMFVPFTCKCQPQVIIDQFHRSQFPHH